jgi:hypothetical protein
MMQRPKVSEVSKWETIFVAEMLHDSRGLHGGIVYIQRGLPFQDYYKVISRMGKAPTKKNSKLFFGESAYNQVEMYVYDLGFRDVLGRI